MKLSLSLTSIIFVAVVTLNGCSKDEKKVNDANAATTPVQVVTSVEPPVIGEFVESNEGDTGCSLKILDEKKQETFLTARYDICDNTNIKKGSVYKFTYKVFEVADCDDECQGSQDCFSKCKKTRKEEQIDSAELVK